VARCAGLARVLGELRVVTGARCRACPRAERRESERVRAGTHVPVVACLGGAGRMQSGVVAWPMGLLGSRA
jgi:hypothetical protein